MIHGYTSATPYVAIDSMADIPCPGCMLQNAFPRRTCANGRKFVWRLTNVGFEHQRCHA